MPSKKHLKASNGYPTEQAATVISIGAANGGDVLGQGQRMRADQ